MDVYVVTCEASSELDFEPILGVFRTQKYCWAAMRSFMADLKEAEADVNDFAVTEDRYSMTASWWNDERYAHIAIRKEPLRS